MRRMWPKIRSSINGKGRSHAYGMRRAESLREAANARDQKANDLAEQVRLLEHQLSLERISAKRYIYSIRLIFFLQSYLSPKIYLLILVSLLAISSQVQKSFQSYILKL